MKITDAANTYNICLHMLVEDGFKLTLDIEREHGLYTASIAKKSFTAEDPLSLLAVSTIKQKKVEQWNQTIYVSNEALLALNLLIKNKYDVKLSNEFSNKWFNWLAYKGEDILRAHTPLRLLALSLIVKKYNDTWREQETPDYYIKLINDGHI